MTVPAPDDPALVHPGWCLPLVCTIHQEGGAHISRARILPTNGPDGDGVMLVLDIIQLADGGPQVRVTPKPSGELDLLLTPSAARTLSKALADLAAIARKDEPR